jgi:ABC-type branched-subunit amino acid transport system substrate-binding protein
VSETIPAAALPAGEHYPFLAPARAPGELGWLDHYRVVRLLGKGGMGIVFQAVDVRLERPVALKVMKPETAQDPAARQRFLREARATAGVRSEHIVTIFEVGQAGELPFLAMELLQGEPLDAWLERQGRPTPAQVLDLGLQIAKGLDAAHRAGLIHRDVKPANVWLEEGTGRAKLLDFGLARSARDDAHLTRTGIIMGTPAYMAPEQAEGEAVDARCDLFSLGCVLYELAAGARPFQGPTAMAVLKATALTHPTPVRNRNPEMPPALAELIGQLMAKRPEDRPASAAAVVEAIQAIAGVSSSTRPALQSGGSIKPPAGKPARRRLLLAGLAGLLGLAVLSAVLLGLFHSETGRPHAVLAQGVSDDEILLGMSAPFTGPARELGRDMKLGLLTYFEHINDQGGVAGRKLKLVTLDDGYEPDRALANMKELYEQRKVFAVIGNVGTPTAQKALPYALEKQMLFFGAFTGAPLLRKSPPDRYVFNFRASYEEETAAIGKYLVEIRKIRPDQVAVFAQQDGYGDAGFRGVARALRKYGRDSKDILRVGHARNSTDVEAAVTSIRQHKDIQAVVMVSTYHPAARFIQLVKDARPNMIFTNVSFVGSAPLAEELRERGPTYAEGVIVTQVVPPISSQSSLVLKYRELLGTYSPGEAPSFISLEGYLNAAILVEGLRRAGADLSTARLIEALESIRDLDLGIGAPISYSPSEHQGSHKVWGTVLDKTGGYQVLELD